MLSAGSSYLGQVELTVVAEELERQMPPKGKE